jgi:hypothetical protein
MQSERIPHSLLRGLRANFKIAKIPYISKFPCSLLQGSSIYQRAGRVSKRHQEDAVSIELNRGAGSQLVTWARSPAWKSDRGGLQEDE